MVQIRENWQKQQKRRDVRTQLLRTDFTHCTAGMFGCIINVLGVKKLAP